MTFAPELIGSMARRTVAILVGGTVQQRASICHAASGGSLHIEPVSSAHELSPRDLTTVDVLLAWDVGDTIAELKGQLAIIGCWRPIVAISETPSARRVVRAVMAGAIDYIDWTSDFSEVQDAIAAAYQAKARMLPRKQRQADAWRLVGTLNRRERQTLFAMAQGMSNKDIARLLKISPRTVEIHRGKMIAKLHANNSADAIRLALEASSATNWVSLDPWAAPWSLDILEADYPLVPVRDAEDETD